MRKIVMSYTIEDLDTIDTAPLESRLPTRACSCEAISSIFAGEAAGPSGNEPQKQRPDLRKYQSVEPRWANTTFLSPEDALATVLADLSVEQSMDGNEYRWELHTSKTDVDLTRNVKCGCHNLTPEEKKPHERGDLRKHHSAETDKWSIRPDHLTPPHDLRKHLSDDSRMARGEVGGWTLQVPEVMPNPKPRCKCPKPTTISPSPLEDKKLRFQDPERRVLYAKSLTPDEPRTAVPLSERPELKKHVSEDVRPIVKEEVRKERGKLVQQKAVVISTGTSKKWDVKERPTALVTAADETRTKAQRSRWAGMPHFSLPVERRDSKWRKGHDSSFAEGAKSKSLKERQKYSVRRSISPEPDPRSVLRLDNRIVKRLISPEITITDAKWAPYEGYSPLPTIGIKKREPKPISEIKWTPYDGSPSDESFANLPPPEDPNRSPFQHPTPCFPPPLATPQRAEDEDEKERWRFLNVISPFPLYQGAWRDESPEKTPPKRYSSPEDLSPPVWSPQQPATPVRRKKAPSPQRATVKSHGASRKRGMRGRSESKHHPSSDRLQLPTSLVRASSEEPKSRMRPQLLRSKALLEVPSGGAISAAKRSQSEEVPRYRASEGWRGPSRAKSEEASRFGDPWFSSIDSESPEVRQYVTTV